MNYFIKAGRASFAIAFIIYGLEQFYFGDFRNIFISPYQYNLPALKVFAYLFGAYLAITGMLILTDKNGKQASALAGLVLLVLYFGTQVTYTLISEKNKIYHLGLWANAFKEIALAGGTFVVAGTFATRGDVSNFFRRLFKFIPYGNLLFLFTMFSFGIGHCMYAQLLQNTLPAWIPDHFFWTYFAGIALIASSTAIALGIRTRVVALLLSLMIFMWFWMMHLPGAIKYPLGNRGELLSSAFDALAFSGIALLIGLTMHNQKWVDDVENWTYKAYIKLQNQVR